MGRRPPTPRDANIVPVRRTRRRYLSLLYRVAGINVVLVLVAVGATIVVLVPGHEASYRIDEEGVAVLATVVFVVVLNLFLLQQVVRPLRRLTAVARTVDLSEPVPALAEAQPDSEAGELAMTFNEMLGRLQAERREATGRVLAGQEAERLRIAQELHDQVGQDLTAALLLLSRVEARAPAELRAAVAEAQDSVRASLEDVRRIGIELRPEALDDLGLESALAVLCDRFAQRSGLEVSFEVTDALPELSANAELVLYRVAQEALTNVARHSGSHHATLSLRLDQGQLVLTVRDQGKGLDAGMTDGSGIRGMRERAGLIGAAIVVRGAGPGTEVTLRVPLEDPA